MFKKSPAILLSTSIIIIVVVTLNILHLASLSANANPLDSLLLQQTQHQHYSEDRGLPNECFDRCSQRLDHAAKLISDHNQKMIVISKNSNNQQQNTDRYHNNNRPRNSSRDSQIYPAIRATTTTTTTTRRPIKRANINQKNPKNKPLPNYNHDDKLREICYSVDALLDCLNSIKPQCNVDLQFRSSLAVYRQWSYKFNCSTNSLGIPVSKIKPFENLIKSAPPSESINKRKQKSTAQPLEEDPGSTGDFNQKIPIYLGIQPNLRSFPRKQKDYDYTPPKTRVKGHLTNPLPSYNGHEHATSNSNHIELLNSCLLLGMVPIIVWMMILS